MREPERIKRVLNLLQQIWELQPDSRFMQMISNIQWNYSADNNDAGKEYSYSKWETPKGIIFNKDVANVDLFYLEDDKLEEYLKGYLDKLNEYHKQQDKTISDLRKELAVKTAPNHGLLDLHRRG
ncbi:hypothetical protein [Bacillus xiapuensis]|uniref:Uncharacterized protein n=1 Tax=Bacillus xiapuensis TaxID=2014075 RepID=A0ABU6N7X2_9BACI|nr:hypothetical protein [Bacillus xiapuensis]